jgi:hypothetical protein
MSVATVEFLSRPVVIVTSYAEVLTFLALFTVLGVARRYWKMTECHVAGCKRHQWKSVPGTNHVVCKKHSPQDEPTHAQVLEDHQAARTAAARKL